jgi:hypothetical protein
MKKYIDCLNCVFYSTGVPTNGQRCFYKSSKTGKVEDMFVNIKDKIYIKNYQKYIKNCPLEK